MTLLTLQCSPEVLVYVVLHEVTVLVLSIGQQWQDLACLHHPMHGNHPVHLLLQEVVGAELQPDASGSAERVIPVKLFSGGLQGLVSRTQWFLVYLSRVLPNVFH